MSNRLASIRFVARLFAGLCLLDASLFAKEYPPEFKDARVETYQKVGATELKLWIFGESDPTVKKPAIVFFFGGGWNGDHRTSSRVRPGISPSAA